MGDARWADDCGSDDLEAGVKEAKEAIVRSMCLLQDHRCCIQCRKS